MPHTVTCQVWCVGGECVSVLFVWWGILCPLPPRHGGGWGHRGWWVAWLVKGGSVTNSPSNAASPVCVLSSPFRLFSGPVEWRGWCAVVLSPCLVLSPVLFTVFPVFGLDPAPRIVWFSSCRAACFLFVLLCCCVVCGEREGGVCGVCGLIVNVVLLSPPFRLVFAVTALLV